MPNQVISKIPYKRVTLTLNMLQQNSIYKKTLAGTNIWKFLEY